MKQYIVASLLLFTLLSGCNSSDNEVENSGANTSVSSSSSTADSLASTPQPTVADAAKRPPAIPAL